MTHAPVYDSADSHARDYSATLVHAARIALYLSAAAALCHAIIGLMPSYAAVGSRTPLLLVYGTIALTAFALQWGIARRAAVARWATVVAGAVMAAFLVAGRRGLVTIWNHLPMPPADLFLSVLAPLIVIGFVVAGICCAAARSDGAGWC